MPGECMCWRGKPIETLTHEESLEAIRLLMRMNRMLLSPRESLARAIGHVELARHGEFLHVG